MNSDKFIVSDYQAGLPPSVESEVWEWLSDCPSEAVKNFLLDVTHEVAMARAHARGRSEGPDARDIQRYLDTVGTHAKRAQNVLAKLSALLQHAPIELRKESRKAGAEIPTVQLQLASLLLAVNDLQPRKEREHPETVIALEKIAECFERRFDVKPSRKAFREIEDISKDAPLDERFVPIAALLLLLTVDRVTRLARKNLPS